MSKYAGELVLVVKRELFEQLGVFEGLRTDGVDAAMEQLLATEVPAQKVYGA